MMRPNKAAPRKRVEIAGACSSRRVAPTSAPLGLGYDGKVLGARPGCPCSSLYRVVEVQALLCSGGLDQQEVFASQRVHVFVF